MTNRGTMELFIEKNGQETVAYPFVEKDHVVFGNGMGIEDVIEQDVTMPTVTHEEVSFKVGVGDQDVSSSIVDSSVGEMVIKGQTYQNILPEPSTHILTNDKEMFKVNEGLDSSVEIVDGVAKSAILKGNTLVNLLNDDNIEQRQASNTSSICGYDKETRTFHFITNLSHPFNYSYISTYGLDKKGVVKYFKNDTDYTIMWYGEKIRDDDDSQTIIRIGASENAYGNPGIYLKDANIKTGKMLYRTQTSYADSVIHPLGIKIVNTNNDIEYKLKFVILEGDYINIDIPYFTGMQSVKMPVLTTTGKNLVDMSKFDSYSHDKGYIEIDTSKYSSSNNNDYNSIKVNLKPKTTYTVSVNYENTNYSNSQMHSIRIYDGDTKIGGKIISSNNTYYTYSFTTTGSTSYKVNITPFNGDTTGIYRYKNMQIEEGTQATSYEPYKSNILTVNEPIELRGIGEVKDTLNLSTGELHLKLGSKNLSDEDIQWRMFPSWETDVFMTFGFETTLGVGLLCNNFIKGDSGTVMGTERAKRSFYAHGTGWFVTINKSELSEVSVQGFKEWLNTNPTFIIYQLPKESVKTVDLSIIDQDGNTSEGLHFFKDGHIQLSSGAGNSLIPTLDYQAKTSNSYVMDLMKTNTKYTMKAKSASGTFTIDGTSYGAGTNGTFTTPSSMTNKFLVMSDKTHEEVMIIEGDVTDKTIPYFKGIKSAFEDEDKIEVLSQGKNLFNAYKHKFDTSSSPGLRVEVLSSNSIRTYCTDTIAWRAAFVVYQLEPHTWYNIRCEVTGNGSKQLDINIPEYGTSWNPNTVNCTQSNNMLGKFLTDKSGKVKLSFQGSGEQSISYDNTYTNIQIEKIQEKSTVHSFYEPYKSNSTKIPLLSPLRSLPNGVCDELIIDRMKKKATLIQRVGDIFVNGSEKWNNMEITTPTNYVLLADNRIKCGKDRHFNNVSSSFPVQSSYDRSKENCYVAHKNQLIFTPFTERFRNLQEFKQWLSQNPTTVYYQLETPVITEVDLEGFPYIYKDGHIFLNSEIAPTTQITYSISQQHQISASTQDLIRHEQEIDYLYKLIAQYIQVDYQSTLLSLDLKLK